LFDHSLSIPTSKPIPRETAIFAATSAGGNLATIIAAGDPRASIKEQYRRVFETELKSLGFSL
jgi:hypothetical protein